MVYLVLNLETSFISPQCHVLFDDSFSKSYSDGQFDSSVWGSLVTSHFELRIKASSSTIDDPTITFPFPSNKEKGAESDNNININDNTPLSFLHVLPILHQVSGTSPLPTITLLSLPS